MGFIGSISINLKTYNAIYTSTKRKQNPHKNIIQSRRINRHKFLINRHINPNKNTHSYPINTKSLHIIDQITAAEIRITVNVLFFTWNIISTLCKNDEKNIGKIQ